MTTAREAEQATDHPLDEAPTTEQADGSLSRRQMIRNAAIAGTVVAAGAGLAACSSGSNSPSPGGNAGTGASGSSGGSGNAVVVGKTSDVPVGGGMIYASDKVVVTQPTAGTYKGFSAMCTHLGCTVNTVSHGQIQCPCHGSAFSITDGSVEAGPAQSALPALNVSVKSGQFVVGA
jgi:Rieske Fe-S protein